MKHTQTHWYLSLGLITAALFGCSESESPSGDAVRGGALYDQWWPVTGQAAPTGDHPLWASRPDTASNKRTGPDTWRCKECHGWDYAGVDGAYRAGSHRTGIRGVLGTQKSEAAIIALLSSSTDHAYGQVLDEQSLADLAAFVTESTIDTTTYIAEDGAFKADAAAGKAAFGPCAACHGSDGLTSPAGAHEPFANFPGFIANDNPQEFLHKVRFGQPGTTMPGQDGLLSDAQLSQLGAYAQSLPQAR